VRWARETVAVNDFVFSGPVLDCPVGTGRFVPIYHNRELPCVGVDLSADMLAEARRKYPSLELCKGSIFGLPFTNKQFATAVCVRLLDWLTPEEMAQAVAELRRVAHILVVSIRYGVERCELNWTHDLNKFYEAINGLYVWRCLVTERVGNDIEVVLRAAAPTWDDVLSQFYWHGHTPAFEMERLASRWLGPCGLYTVGQAKPKHVKISSEYWWDHELMSVIERMSEEHDWDLPDEYCYVTNESPRYNQEGPATLVTKGGRTVVLDGRRRINQWHGTGRRCPVLHLRVPDNSGGRPRQVTAR
jgi:hypothetical protein